MFWNINEKALLFSKTFTLECKLLHSFNISFMYCVRGFNSRQKVTEFQILLSIVSINCTVCTVHHSLFQNKLTNWITVSHSMHSFFILVLLEYDSISSPPPILTYDGGWNSLIWLINRIHCSACVSKLMHCTETPIPANLQAAEYIDRKYFWGAWSGHLARHGGFSKFWMAASGSSKKKKYI